MDSASLFCQLQDLWIYIRYSRRCICCLPPFLCLYLSLGINNAAVHGSSSPNCHLIYTTNFAQCAPFPHSHSNLCAFSALCLIFLLFYYVLPVSICPVRAAVLHNTCIHFLFQINYYSFSVSTCCMAVYSRNAASSAHKEPFVQLFSYRCCYYRCYCRCMHVLADSGAVVSSVVQLMTFSRSFSLYTLCLVPFLISQLSQQ